MAVAPVPRNPDYTRRVRESFARQGIMATLGIELDEIAPGRVVLTLEHRPGLTQQHGFVHAGVLTTAMDSACGYAAFTLFPAEAEVLTVEFKANFLAPAAGTRFRIEAGVVRSGRTITVTEARCHALGAGAADRLVAMLTATMMAVPDPGASGRA